MELCHSLELISSQQSMGKIKIKERKNERGRREILFFENEGRLIESGRESLDYLYFKINIIILWLSPSKPEG